MVSLEREPKRFGIYVSFKNCQGFEMKVKTFWHPHVSVDDNIGMILDSNHFCRCQQPQQLQQ